MKHASALVDPDALDIPALRAECSSAEGALFLFQDEPTNLRPRVASSFGLRASGANTAENAFDRSLKNRPAVHVTIGVEHTPPCVRVLGCFGVVERGYNSPCVRSFNLGKDRA
jgi:hypothetical protein